MGDLPAFEIRPAADGQGFDLVGPHIQFVRYETILECYQHWERCFAPLLDVPLKIQPSCYDEGRGARQ